MSESKSRTSTPLRFLEVYDAYEVKSAFIKSIRLGKVEDAIYWLEVMLQGDAKPVNIAKRLVIKSQESGYRIRLEFMPYTH